MKKIVTDIELIKTEQAIAGNYILHFQSPQTIPPIHPGNFAELLIPDASDVFLRRPFSFLDVDYQKQQFSFYIKAIGKGTDKLGHLPPGSQLNIIYPLGNAYTIDDSLKKVLIVGGGSGIAPFILLGRELRAKNIEVAFLLGGRTKNDILLTERFSEFGEVKITTEDGSRGEKGLVTQHSIFDTIDRFDKIYTCGPNPMMKAVGQLAEARNIPCEASLENTMACGFGVCLCCITPTQNGNQRVCVEGPVFNTKQLRW